MTATRVPVIEGLFAETPRGPRLLGSRCAGCGTPYFPKSAACHNPRCEASRIEDALLGPNGLLWSYTVQHFPPPAPVVLEQPFRPYAIGMVDLADGLRVFGRIDCEDFAKLSGGLPVELAIARLGTDAEGKELVSWVFRPR